MSNLIFKAKVGKKYAIYLPQRVVKALDLKEGERILMRISGNTLIIEKLEDPIQLALTGKKFASLTPEQVKAISLEEQEKYIKDSP
ncbi:MAG: AbrB/MazE/SpoVT family DNA-binding domain-containing protein [Thermoprotei archaeon]|nr:MAG: AbrB/MazE/SpoVT family DNA-binding domain-containing protein [Thermoprotei archaeon]